MISIKGHKNHSAQNIHHSHDLTYQSFCKTHVSHGNVALSSITETNSWGLDAFTLAIQAMGSRPPVPRSMAVATLSYLSSLIRPPRLGAQPRTREPASRRYPAAPWQPVFTVLRALYAHAATKSVFWVGAVPYRANLTFSVITHEAHAKAKATGIVGHYGDTRAVGFFITALRRLGLPPRP
jgi:hypothetical protein